MNSNDNLKKIFLFYDKEKNNKEKNCLLFTIVNCYLSEIDSNSDKIYSK